MRKSGVLMHISSLPGKYGIGTLGKNAREFVDFLEKAGQSYWQVLPVGPTSLGDSPYQSVCSEAGNPYFIDLEILAGQGLLDLSDFESVDWQCTDDRINYGAMYEKRYDVLRKAAEKFLSDPDDSFKGFCLGNAYWLDEYALFMALKGRHGGRAWYDWDEPLRTRDHEKLKEAQAQMERDIRFWKTLQYFFFQQWHSLKKYANEKGIFIIGDLPIYVSHDSVDVWAHPENFQMDENGQPMEVAGCPPDAFTPDGQLWGNPLYDWEKMSENGYAWWIKKIEYQTNVFDVLRIDHFRGFESYYAIPYGDLNAKRGRWRPGPGIALFKEAENVIGKKEIIAEDLGFLTPQVLEMLKESGYPGMKILEFAFDVNNPGENIYLPHNYIENCIAYVGTHDNDTAVGWYRSLGEAEKQLVREYMGLNDGEGIAWGMMRNIWISPAKLAIVQAQDLLQLGSEARMNTPATLGENWKWRACAGSFSEELAARLRRSTVMYGRL